MLAFQPEFRPALPVVSGPKDYRILRSTMIEMDNILTSTGLENRFILDHIEEAAKGVSQRRFQSLYRTTRLALRYTLLSMITNHSFRELATRVSDSPLFQWFTYTSYVDKVKPVSKSSIERFEKLFSIGELEKLIHDINRAVADEQFAKDILCRETALKVDKIFADTTCIKANIHAPVDWMLFRDATRTLVNGVLLIRSKGLYHRISAPEKIMCKMNKLCMEMTHARKKKGAKKLRKAVLRRMKHELKITKNHAKNYHELLSQRWEETDWTELEAKIVLERMQAIIDIIPKILKQAHERIIGERRVANKDKILSLYEPDVHVLVRGKAGSEVEFGNALYIAEQEDGIIVDWKLFKDSPPHDSKITPASIERITKEYQKPAAYVADRGFDSPKNNIDLEELSIINAICPRSVPLLKEKLKDNEFCSLQKRRSGTEARIAILCNNYIGQISRRKGFKNRELHVAWSILTHNLWKLATMAAQKRLELEEELQKAA